MFSKDAIDFSYWNSLESGTTLSVAETDWAAANVMKTHGAVGDKEKGGW